MMAPEPLLIQPEHVDTSCCSSLSTPASCPLLHHDFNLLLRDRRRLGRAKAEELQHRLRQDAQEPDEGIGNFREQAHRPGDRDGDLGHGEKTVHQDQEQKNQESHGERLERRRWDES